MMEFGKGFVCGWMAAVLLGIALVALVVMTVPGRVVCQNPMVVINDPKDDAIGVQTVVCEDGTALILVE